VTKVKPFALKANQANNLGAECGRYKNVVLNFLLIYLFSGLPTMESNLCQDLNLALETLTFLSPRQSL
jgi:hypothetical protein